MSTSTKLSASQKGLAPILIVILIALILGVGGYFVYQNQIKLPTPVPTPPPQQTIQPTPYPTSKDESTSSAETANWKTYKSDRLQISFKYPEDWRLNDIIYPDGDLQIIDFYYSKLPKGSLPILTMNVYSNPKNLSLENFHKSGRDTNCPVYYSESKKILISDGKTAYYTERGFCEPLEAKIYVWIHNNYIFQFRSKDYQKIGNQDKIFDQIVSTFEFLP